MPGQSFRYGCSFFVLKIKIIVPVITKAAPINTSPNAVELPPSERKALIAVILFVSSRISLSLMVSPALQRPT